jgi:drug/metabolite transporter (DMT)-like permease
MIYLFIASFLWGTSFVAGKYAVAVTDIAIIVTIRLMIASLFIAPMVGKYFKGIRPTTWLKLIGVSFLTYPATFFLQFIGLKYTTASSAAIVIGFEPLIIVFIGHYLFREKATKKDLTLSITALLGILLVIGMPSSDDFHMLGCLLIFISTFVVAVWVRWSKQIMQEVPKGSYTPLTLMLGTLLSIPCTLLLAEDWTFNMDIQGIAAIVYLGVGCSLIAGWAWNKGLETTNANTGGLYLALEPVFGIFFGVMLLGEYFNFYGGLGVVIVLMSVFTSITLTLRAEKKLTEIQR